eukprot:PRCOL_00004152-RA
MPAERLSSLSDDPAAAAAAAARALSAAADDAAAAAERAARDPAALGDAAAALSRAAEPFFARYDPEAFAAYFRRRPLRVARRLLKVAAVVGRTYAATLGKGDEVKAARLREALVALGPALIKAGQVASSRSDLVPATYVEALKQLQDRVPAFPTEQARALIAAELGPAALRSLEGIEDADAAPVAAASLGQVYRCRVRAAAAAGDAGGDAQPTREVAVKVQRPGIVEEIALDLLVLRTLAPVVRARGGLNSDLQGLVDEWGTRFMDELDYTLEARNGAQFYDAMRARGLDAVTTARVEPGLCSRRVLTTEWIDGERLDRSDAADVPLLCGVALTAYLTMLLDTGTLHSDPHPGNLLRTRDGRLCILDFGLVTEIESEKRFAILEYIVHLIGRDYKSVPQDLLALGFIPPGKSLAMEDEGVVRVLADVFRALAKGGGAKGVTASLADSGFSSETAAEARRQIQARREARGDAGATRSALAAADAAAALSAPAGAGGAGGGSRVEELGSELARIQETYGNLFQIPSYFALILRAFSILEGIGLQTDPDYAIAQECYPYVARRLLTDRSPRARAALESLVYGPGGGRRLDVKRIRQLSDAFVKYAPTATLAAGAPGAARALDGGGAILGPGAREALRVAAAPEGGPLQDIALREAVRLADAAAREAAAGTLGVALGALLAPVRVLSPQLAAAETGFAAPLLELNEDDRASLAARDELAEALAAALGGAGDGRAGGAAPLLSPPASAAELQARLQYGRQLLGELGELAPELAPGAQAAAVRLGAAALQHAAERLEAAGAARDRAQGGAE